MSEILYFLIKFIIPPAYRIGVHGTRERFSEQFGICVRSGIPCRILRLRTHIGCQKGFVYLDLIGTECHDPVSPNVTRAHPSETECCHGPAHLVDGDITVEIVRYGLEYLCRADELSLLPVIRHTVEPAYLLFLKIWHFKLLVMNLQLIIVIVEPVLESTLVEIVCLGKDGIMVYRMLIRVFYPLHLERQPPARA